MNNRYLLLEDGTYFKGEALGTSNFKVGELVFNTNMAGYQEILCDSTFSGQIIVMTYPMIGNYGINRDGFESVVPSIFGFVISESCDSPSNFRSQTTLENFLRIRNIPAISDVDTRMVTRHIRKNGNMKAILTDTLENLDDQVAKIKNTDLPIDLVKNVSITKPFHIPNFGKRVVLVDLGSTNEIIRELNKKQMDISVVPYDFSPSEIDSLHVDAIILSNGPGNPKDLTNVISNIKSLIGRYPILGFGLGHQIIALACGGEVEKLHIGHRGANYPVKNLNTGRTDIKTCNNGYSVNVKSLDNTNLRMIFQGADGTCEGLEDASNHIFSVQFYPDKTSENDNIYNKFIQMIDAFKEENNA